MLKIKLISLSVHKTFEFFLGDKSYYGDLYYFCLDNTFFENDQSLAKGVLNFLAMLENWKLKIEKLGLSQRDFLPFDYSDQYIGFFIISKISNEEILIQYGYTPDYFGWGTNPSQLYVVDIIDKSYRTDHKEYVIPISQLVQEINGSISTILSEFYTKIPSKTDGE